jgi:fibronectin-binding autotransporter adhesin
MAGRKTKRWTVLSAAVAGVASMVAGGAKADLQFTSLPVNPANGGPVDGAGVWDLTTLDWLTNTGVLTNYKTDNAIFGGNYTGTQSTGLGGLVSLGSNVAVNNMTFNTNGYTIGGASPFGLTLAAGDVITTNKDAGISAPIIGTTFTKSGSGTLYLENTRGFGAAGSAITVNGGRLSIVNEADLGVAGEAVNLNGGTLLLGQNVQLTSHPINFGAGGGTLEVMRGNISN